MRMKLLVLTVPFLLSCERPRPERSLQALGLETLRIGDRAWLDCGRYSAFGYSFEAKSKGGQIVTGTACCLRGRETCYIRPDLVPDSR